MIIQKNVHIYVYCEMNSTMKQKAIGCLMGHKQHILLKSSNAVGLIALI